jgi:hypothetical protein
MRQADRRRCAAGGRLPRRHRPGPHRRPGDAGGGGRAVLLAVLMARPALAILDGLDGFLDRQRERVCGVLLAEQEGVLHGFLQGLAGRRLRLVEGEAVYTDSETLFLPRVMARYPASGDNFLLYKASIAMLWAQIRFGTLRLLVQGAVYGNGAQSLGRGRGRRWERLAAAKAGPEPDAAGRGCKPLPRRRMAGPPAGTLPRPGDPALAGPDRPRAAGPPSGDGAAARAVGSAGNCPRIGRPWRRNWRSRERRPRTPWPWHGASWDALNPIPPSLGRAHCRPEAVAGLHRRPVGAREGALQGGAGAADRGAGRTPAIRPAATAFREALA